MVAKLRDLLMNGGKHCRKRTKFCLPACSPIRPFYFQKPCSLENIKSLAMFRDRLLQSRQRMSFNSFPNDKFLVNSKLKEFADDKFKFDEKWQKLFQMVRKHCEKRRNCSLRAISPFPTVFSKELYYRHVKTRACLGTG